MNIISHQNKPNYLNDNKNSSNSSSYSNHNSNNNDDDKNDNASDWPQLKNMTPQWFECLSSQQYLGIYISSNIIIKNHH